MQNLFTSSFKARMGSLALAALVWLVLAVPAVRHFYIFSALPYMSMPFFLLLFAATLTLYGLRQRLNLSMDRLWFGLNLGYFVFLFPQPVHVLAFGCYFYGVYRLYRDQPHRTATAELLFFTLVPMLVGRTTVEVRFLGLSYITFRVFHLSMDRKYIAPLSFPKFFTFVTFFPAVLAGPIDRIQKLGPQMTAAVSQAMTLQKIENGYRALLFGACLKFVLAEIVDRTITAFYDTPGAAGLALKIYGYAVYLYLDFAGYSAMAIGAGLMLGLQLPKNFDKPFLSQNPQDFWRRFHITLGEWLRDYFFKPLYKALHGVEWLKTRPLWRQNISLFTTFLLMGAWNGSRAHFLLSGALFGVGSVVHNSYTAWRKTHRPESLRASRPWSRPIAIFCTVTFCSIALYIFSGQIEGPS